MNPGPLTTVAHRLGLSQRQLAAELGWSVRQVRYVNDGQQAPTMPMRRSVQRLAGFDPWEEPDRSQPNLFDDAS